jgi:hypothetical protein
MVLLMLLPQYIRWWRTVEWRHENQYTRWLLFYSVTLFKLLALRGVELWHDYVNDASEETWKEAVMAYYKL